VGRGSDRRHGQSAVDDLSLDRPLHRPRPMASCAAAWAASPRPGPRSATSEGNHPDRRRSRARAGKNLAGRANVVLTDGEEISSRLVISNADEADVLPAGPTRSPGRRLSRPGHAPADRRGVPEVPRRARPAT
jgi:hypothetical protein